jgi:hypothetical protein
MIQPLLDDDSRANYPCYRMLTGKNEVRRSHAMGEQDHGVSNGTINCVISGKNGKRVPKC